MEWRFRIPGQPIPQPRVRVSTRGGFARAYVPARHPIHAYRQAIALASRHAGTITGACSLEISAVFARPASHWRKVGLAKSAPEWPGHRDGDLDNVAKAVADSLPFADDTQVVRLVAEKRYAARDEEPHTVVLVRTL